MEQYVGAEALLEILNVNGVEQVFFNPGGDVSPVQAAICRYRVAGKASPKMILCLHETVAMAAAIGHYMVSGKPQLVMVHSELGAQQLGGQVHNAQWGRTPVVIMAGLTPAPRRTNWKNEPFSQGLMFRNNVKWDIEIGPQDDFHEIMQKAFDTAMSEPRGPVFVSYARDVFTNQMDRSAIRKPSAMKPVISKLDIKQLGTMADLLISAVHPVIVAGSTGRYAENIPKLIELAETMAIPVMPGLTRMNFPTTHPLCAGTEHIGGSRGINTPLTEADVILAIDYDTPYVPADGFPNKETKILHIDFDPLTQGRPLWGRGADIFLKADSREAIPWLTKIARSKITPEKQQTFRERASRFAAKHARQKQEYREMAVSKSNDKPVSPDWVAYCLSQVIDEDTVLVNHLISQAASPTEQIERTKPFSLLACAGGNIGFAVGAALGAKIAAPDKLVVGLMTDGGFTWGCPISALWSSRAYQAPFLYVIFNNQSYGAIRVLVEQMSESKISDELGFESGVDIDPPVDTSFVAQSCGGWGKVVTEPADVLPALQEGIRQVKSGRAAIVDVRLPKGV
jgi:acetolactate synthase I/II/III large subunit